MMKDKKIKFAFFTIPEYEKEQNWLRKQHNEGWELTRVTLLGIYHFKKCEPQDVVYQLDYSQDGRQNKVAYIQMFKDCKWEYITDYVGYSYFRKAVADMKLGEEEIFSDDESKLEMSRRVFKGRMIPLFIIFFLVIIPQLFIQYSLNLRPLFYAYIVLFALYVVLFIWFGVQYFKLKKKISK